jgi:hypothetical protein
MSLGSSSDIRAKSSSKSLKVRKKEMLVRA